jgi:hypothetical protein
MHNEAPLSTVGGTGERGSLLREATFCSVSMPWAVRPSIAQEVVRHWGRPVPSRPVPLGGSNRVLLWIRTSITLAGNSGSSSTLSIRTGPGNVGKGARR